MRSYFRTVLVVAALLSMSLRADIITLTDGRTVEGEIVSETPSEIVVKASAGKTTIKREEIQSIERKKSASLVYREKIDVLEKSANKLSLDAWLSLANEAGKMGARDEATKAYAKVMKLDPENAAERKALGFVRSGGEGVDKNELKEKAAAVATPVCRCRGGRGRGDDQGTDRCGGRMSMRWGRFRRSRSTARAATALESGSCCRV